MAKVRAQAFDISLYLSVESGHSNRALGDVTSLLKNLDRGIGQLQLKLGEDEKGGPTLDDDAEISPYITSDFGFMAISKLANIEVTKDRPPRSGVQDGLRISILLAPAAAPKAGDVVHQIEAWATKTNLICGWGCSEPEERHHLFADLKLPNGSIESYLGRDHRTRVPGLFWWNLWSLDWLEERQIQLASLPPNWEVVRHDSAPVPFVVVRSTQPWRQWSTYVSEARAWANATEGVFSMDEVLAAKPADLNEMSALRFLRNWD